jgi:hypothetical protein
VNRFDVSVYAMLAARMGLDFDPLTGEPTAWNLPEPATVTWHQEATAYAVLKWPSLAAHSRASVWLRR